MKTLARGLAGLGLVMAGLLLPQSPALAITTESAAGSAQAVMEATHLPTQLPDCGPRNLGAVIVDGDDLLECVSDPTDPVDPYGWELY